jgi:hypothetical protein
MQPVSTALDPTLHSPRVREIKTKLLARTIGQDQAVDKMSGILETFFAGYNDPKRPVSVVLELGPTGTGKTWSRRPAGPKAPRAHAAETLHPLRPSSSRNQPGLAGSTSRASRGRSTAAVLWPLVYEGWSMSANVWTSSAWSRRPAGNKNPRARVAGCHPIGRLLAYTTQSCPGRAPGRAPDQAPNESSSPSLIALIRSADQVHGFV